MCIERDYILQWKKVDYFSVLISTWDAKYNLNQEKNIPKDKQMLFELLS